VPDAMVNDAIKKKARYMYYMAKKVKTNVPNKLKKDDVPRKTRSLTIAEEAVVDKSANETDDANELDMDLSNNNIDGDDDDASQMRLLPHKINFMIPFYESIILDQDALDAQAAQSSFHKRSHDNHDPPNNREEENKKKHQKDVGEPSSRSSRPSAVTIAKKFKELIQKDELTIADFKSSGLKRLKVHYNNDVELKYHVSQLKAAVLSESYTEEKYTTSITKIYVARYYKEGIKDRIPERWSKEVRRCYFEALNVRRSDEKEYEFSYADLSRPSVNDVEDMYLLQVQDKLHHLPLGSVKDFNNALLMFIKRTVIKNIVEDI
nr:hypothetical protein [Tanacetum cinerariifolium]